MKTPRPGLCPRAAFCGAALFLFSTAHAGLIGEWRFNESGPTAKDGSGLGYDLVLRRDKANAFDGHSAAGAGVSGRAGDRAFDPYGWTHYKNGHACALGMIPDAYARLERFTVSAWVKINRMPKMGETLFLLHADNRIKITFYTRDDSGWGTLELNGRKIGSGAGWLSEADVGRWVNLAVTYDATLSAGAARFYRGDATTAIASPFAQAGNGRTAGFGAGSLLHVAADTGLILGNVHDANRTWCGLIDEVRMFDAVLEAAELDALRQKSLAGP